MRSLKIEMRSLRIETGQVFVSVKLQFRALVS